jgi:integrase
MDINKQLSFAIGDGLVIDATDTNAAKIFDLLDVSEATRQDYKYRIRLYLDFISTGKSSVNSFLEYKRYLASRTDLSIATKNKYLASAKIFLKELNRIGMLPRDITQNVKAFNQDKKHKRDGVNSDEMARLSIKLQGLDNTPQNTRLKAMICLLALQGLRQIEIVRLDVKDLDLVRMTAMVQGKGRDDKEAVSLHPETVKALKEYLKANKKASGALFTSVSNCHRNERLTTRSIRKIVTTMLLSLDIDKSTHGFRHFFTTTLIKTYKGDLTEVAQYTRHRGLEMLMVYNDAIKKEADLPRYYSAFEGVNFNG